MKILPLLKDRPDLQLFYGHGRFGRKAMALILSPLETFPVGTPHYAEGCVVTKAGEVAMFHANQPQFWFSDGVAIAPSKRLGAGRKMLRRLIEKYPPLDRSVQAYQLRKLVREGD